MHANGNNEVRPVTLVLLPGLDGTGILFEPLLKHLSQQISALVIALPYDRALDYSNLVDVVSSSLPRDESYFLLGESFSGPLALMLADKNPSQLKGVILCATFIRNPTYLPSILYHLAGTWMFHFSPLFIQAKALFSGYSTPELRQLLRKAHEKVQPSVMANRIRAVLRLNCERELKQCSVPLAYIRGSFDRVVPRKNCAEILRLKPSVREYVISAPHLVLQTQPAAAAEAIERFIKDVDGLHP
jgi:pimeloyl-[acyl-carrier protein] methyl ester esterase